MPATPTFRAERLNVFLAGNVESNFNKLDVFIDSGAGGQNVVGSTQTTTGNFTNTGLRFDAGFADYALDLADQRRQHVLTHLCRLRQPPYRHRLPTPAMATAGKPDGSRVGNGRRARRSILTLNNTNTTRRHRRAPVRTCGDVATGVELRSALADIGYTGGNDPRRRLHQRRESRLSPPTSSIGSLPAATGNLGGDGAGNYTGGIAGLNLANYAGNQFFSVPSRPPSPLWPAWASVALRRRK